MARHRSQPAPEREQSPSRDTGAPAAEPSPNSATEAGSKSLKPRPDYEARRDAFFARRRRGSGPEIVSPAPESPETDKTTLPSSGNQPAEELKGQLPNEDASSSYEARRAAFMNRRGRSQNRAADSTSKQNDVERDPDPRFEP